MRVYLDNCCYNRIFDDRNIAINYLERETILLILQYAYYHEELNIIGSEALIYEIGKTRDITRKLRLFDVYADFVESELEVSENIVDLSKKIRDNSNIRDMDSLHLALAESHCDVLLSTDSKFVKNSKKLSFLNIKVMNPIEFVIGGGLL